MKRKCEFIVPSSPYNYLGGLSELLKKEYYDGEKVSSCCELKKWLIDDGQVFCWNLQRSEETSFSGEGLFETYGEQVSSMIIKHPGRMKRELEHFPKNGRILVSDRSYGAFLEKYYNRESVFVPMPGVLAKKQLPWKKRTNEVFFAGTYLDPDTTEKQIKEKLADELQPLIWYMIKLLRANPLRTLEEVILEGFEKFSIEITRELVCDFSNEYGIYIEEYINRYYRKKLITYLLKKGIPIAVLGSNWLVLAKELKPEERHNLKIMSEGVSINVVADYMASVKVVLDSGTAYKDGIHERVSTALINGAVCFTERNPYAEELASKNPNLRLYEYGRINRLTQHIKKVLDSKENLGLEGEQVFSIDDLAKMIGQMM